MSSEMAGAIEDNSHILQLPVQLRQPSGDITTIQRMISACLGSLVTSLVVTPFDVVRIRVQQQEVMPTSYACCNARKPALDVSTLKTVALAVESSSPGVFWINQHYCSEAEACPRITSTLQGMMTISKTEGVRTLWRGLSLTLFMAIPSNIIYFTGYEYIRDHSPVKNQSLNPLLCGMAARTMAATVVAPVELLKTRLQSIPSGSHDKAYNILSTLLRDSADAFRSRGVGSMFTGLKITLWRDVPFLGIYWMCYEMFKQKFGKSLGVNFNSPSETQEDWKVFTASFLSGSLGGVIAAFFTNPFDVGKTRLQIATEQKPAATRPSMFRYLFRIYKTEGVRAMYGGFGPRVMKIAPLCAIMISSYEIGKKIFKDSM